MPLDSNPAEPVIQARDESLPLDYERRTIDFAKQVLGDIPECAEADYSVRWIQRNGRAEPLLVLAFHLPETLHQPALAVALVTVRRGTLLEVMPGRTLQEGDKLKSHVRRSVEHYLKEHGVRLSLDIEEGAKHAYV